MTRVEIVTRGQARREYTPDERARVLTEAAMPGARVLLVAQRYGISPSLMYRWRREAAGRAARQAPPRAPRFVPLLVDDGGTRQGGGVPPSAPMQDAGTDRVEVVLRNGRLLRVGAGMDATVVARLAAALEA
ncbi:transposase [Paeniroseomonas aquatica]|uniref:IS66-like element accessory protein TnpA n=1 Tax=Paeniroseomonas aquatica TaxID=373043 RepID=UPI00360F94E0